MLPPIGHPVWEKLITGEKQMRSSNVAINLLLFNSKLRYQKDPSPANLNLLIIHTYEVFKKQEVILDEAELRQLTS